MGTVGIPFLLKSFNYQLSTINSSNYWWGFVPTSLILTVILVLQHIDRHEIAVWQSFLSSLLIAIASYWLPTILFMLIPVIAFLIHGNHFNMRAFTAMLLGIATIAIWSLAFYLMKYYGISPFPFRFPWAHFFEAEQAWGWIPTGSFLLAWLASTIARETLRMR